MDRGWYGLAGYTFAPKPVTAFYRYDTLDSGDANDYNRQVVGLLWDRDKAERFTVQLEDITNDGSGKKFTNFAVQYQVKY